MGFVAGRFSAKVAVETQNDPIISKGICSLRCRSCCQERNPNKASLSEAKTARAIADVMQEEMIMKRIAIWGLIGVAVTPLAFLVFAYASGLTFRPEGIDVGEALRLINDSTWRVSTFLEDILPVWMPAGGILGVVGSLAIKRKPKLENANTA